jgi:site-specific recombinase XerD
VCYTYDDFRTEFLAYSKGQHKQKTYDGHRSSTKLFGEFIDLRTPLADITVMQCQHYITKKSGDTSPASARRELRAMAAMFECGVKWKKLTTNVWRSVATPRVPDRTPRWLTAEEFETLIDKLDDRIDADQREYPTYRRRQEREAAHNRRVLRQVLVVAFGTGLRSAELQYLRVEDCDLVRKLIHVQNRDDWSTKTGHQRIVPMTGRVWRVLFTACRDKEGSALVFQMLYKRRMQRVREDWLGRSFKKCVIAAGLDRRLRFHDLRHSFASTLASTGMVTLYHIGQLLGHRDPKTTAIYAHLLNSDLTKATKALDDLDFMTFKHAEN